MATTNFRLDPQDFNYALRMARKAGAKFNAADKTWSLPREISAESFRVNRWIPVAAAPSLGICDYCGTFCYGDCTAG